MKFPVKKINFFGRSCAILCQTNNGPCPLIALFNILSLQNRISSSSDFASIGYITLDAVVTILADIFISNIHSKKGHNEFENANQSQLESILNILPKLAKGLDLNINFESVDKFEFTEELCVFDAIDISLFHAWCADPIEDEVVNLAIAKGCCTYNHFVNKVIEYKSLLDQAKTKKNCDSGDISDFSPVEAPLEYFESSILLDGAALEMFLDKNPSQMTFYGLTQLHNNSIVRERQLSVLFHNNHFSVMFKYHNSLYLLVTDSELAFVDTASSSATSTGGESVVCWELLDDLEGDTVFANHDFSMLSFQCSQNSVIGCNDLNKSGGVPNSINGDCADADCNVSIIMSPVVAAALGLNPMSKQTNDVLSPRLRKSPNSEVSDMVDKSDNATMTSSTMVSNRINYCDSLPAQTSSIEPRSDNPDFDECSDFAFALQLQEEENRLQTRIADNANRSLSAHHNPLVGEPDSRNGGVVSSYDSHSYKAESIYSEDSNSNLHRSDRSNTANQRSNKCNIS